ncbi:MAG: lysophospholipid acyltransferase family protein, partial [Verrucomicrobia bacterium]
MKQSQEEPGSAPPPGELVRMADVLPLLGRPGLRWAGRVLERLLALDIINRVHAAAVAEAEPRAFLTRALEAFGVRYEVDPAQLLRIPSEGPVVVVANHPFGGVDAIILTALLAGMRGDARVMANHLLLRIPQVRPVLIGVDPFGGPEAARRNVRGMQEALDHLMDGGLLGVFPSGTVSHLQLPRGVVEDPPWTQHLFRLVKRSGATVVPVFFEGRNSALFQAAGLVHPLLRTALIPRETARRRGEVVRLAVGRPLPKARIEGFDDAARFTRFLRVQTYLLGERKAAAPAASPKPAGRRGREPEPIAPPEPVAALAAEVARIPAEDQLVQEGDFRVFVARWSRDPALLREIGRLREETFRAAGEGSGRARDLDGFDRHYLQIVLWDDARQCVAGGYRVARVDRVLRARGRRALYTATLFRFRPGFLRELGPAMELGRSWIRLAYQRKHNALALLWRGIAALVVREPEACVLFGPVSISRDYQPLSRGLIVSFLRETLLDRGLASAVKPVKPYRLQGRAARLAREAGRAVRTIDDVSLLVSEIEADGKGVPILFRHYLRLHSIVLSFNVDPAFADVVDGLLLTDLRRTDPKILQRFMGAEGLARFRAFH